MSELHLQCTISDHSQYELQLLPSKQCASISHKRNG